MTQKDLRKAGPWGTHVCLEETRWRPIIGKWLGAIIWLSALKCRLSVQGNYFFNFLFHSLRPEQTWLHYKHGQFIETLWTSVDLKLRLGEMAFKAPSRSGPGGSVELLSAQEWGPPPLRSEGPCPWGPLLPPCLAPPNGTFLLTTWPLCFSNSLPFFTSVFRGKVKIEKLAFLGHCGWSVREIMR